MKISNNEWKHLSAHERSLLQKKGVYPYDYVDSHEKLAEKNLPRIESFYNELTGTKISEKKYRHAKNIWHVFGIKTMQEYTDLYLKTDVLLLADVFERFRDACIQNYHLDPAHYFTTPGLSFDAMLFHTGVNIELITDIDQLLFIEKGEKFHKYYHKKFKFIHYTFS